MLEEKLGCESREKLEVRLFFGWDFFFFLLFLAENVYLRWNNVNLKVTVPTYFKIG